MCPQTYFKIRLVDWHWEKCDLLIVRCHIGMHTCMRVSREYCGYTGYVRVSVYVIMALYNYINHVIERDISVCKLHDVVFIVLHLGRSVREQICARMRVLSLFVYWRFVPRSSVPI